MKTSALGSWRGIRVLGVASLLSVSTSSGLAQSPPWITIPTSAVATGDVVTVTLGSFVPGSVVTLNLTSPSGGGWSHTLGIGAGGSVTYPVHFTEEGFYRLEVLARDGRPLTMLMVSAARHNR